MNSSGTGRLARHLVPPLLAAIAALAGPHPAHAASVEQTSVDEMLAGSEFVFEGEVLSASVEEVRQLGGAGRSAMYTVIEFLVLDVVKAPPDGPRPGDTVSLAFRGGRMGDRAEVVHDLAMPNPGEKGVYFVERLDRRQVNPLYGWTQGHFLVVGEGAGSQITTADSKPVSAVESTPPDGRTRISTGIARGVRTETSKRSEASQRAMTPTEFKDRLRELLR